MIKTKEKIKKLEEGIEKIARLNNTQIRKELAFNFNPFRESYRYFDTFNMEYKAHINRKGEIFVRVMPIRIEKIFNFNKVKKEYIIKGEKIYRKTDEEIIIKFILQFFKRRNFNIFEGNDYRILSPKKFEISVEGNIGEIEIVRTKPFLEVIIRDKEKPFLCPINYQYVFRFKDIIEVEKEDEVFIDFEETEISISTFSPFNLLRRSIYGFGSSNLRNFYSEEGIFPEVKHTIRQTVLGNFAGSIVIASVFVRVAERLKGNTWYTLTSGILAFIRAPAEIYFMKKSLKLTENFPSTQIKKFFDKGKIKEIIGSKEINGWRNFERKIFDIFKKRENFIYLVEKYSNFKFKIYKLVENGKKEEIFEILKNEFKFSDDDIEQCRYHIENLQKIDVGRITDEIKKEIINLYKDNLLKPGGEYMLFKYIEEIFKENIIRLPVNKAFKLLSDRLKDEEKELTKEEISNFIGITKRKIEPFRFLDLFTLFSLFAMGYFATFLRGLNEITILIYYIFYGAITNVILAAVNRYGGQIGFQYLYRALENSPNITSAADTWNEFNSHIMRLWAVFSSFGTIVGILGKVFSDITGGFSRYFVEGIALILYIMAIREWFLYYHNLEKRSKMEE
ncbi:MAG: hypothetical protein NC915_04225 [Candidatus Omnitrophica bacterium]|nr:hypothetical protein [Candidatus Omnitrophota bacterium]